MKHQKHQGVLIEREGVLLHRTAANCSASWNDFDFLPLALDALRLFAEYGIAVILVSDQSCVKDGHLTMHELDKLTRRMLLEVALSGGHIQKVYYCPHNVQDPCLCRKPFPGLLVRAMAEGHLNPSHTYFIGSQERDMEAAKRAGCNGLLLRRNSFLTTDTRSEESIELASNLYEAAERIVRRNIPRLADVLQMREEFPNRSLRPESAEFHLGEKDLA